MLNTKKNTKKKGNTGTGNALESALEGKTPSSYSCNPSYSPLNLEGRFLFTARTDKRGKNEDPAYHICKNAVGGKWNTGVIPVFSSPSLLVFSLGKRFLEITPEAGRTFDLTVEERKLFENFAGVQLRISQEDKTTLGSNSKDSQYHPAEKTFRGRFGETGGKTDNIPLPKEITREIWTKFIKKWAR